MVQLDVDTDRDVLCARRVDAVVAGVRGAAVDEYLSFDVDEHDEVVGIRLCSASGMVWSLWREHPDRKDIPEDMRDALDAWFKLQDG